jgi:hypothetical protein
MPPTFFLKVRRHCTTPFWHYHALQLTDSGQTSNAPVPLDIGSSREDEEHEDEEDEGNLVDTEADAGLGGRGTLCKWVIEDIWTLWDFCDGLEYQLQFNDHQMFQTMEREGAVFMWFAHNCLSHENRLNSMRGSTPSMWERSTASTMFYRARPPRRDVNS